MRLLFAITVGSLCAVLLVVFAVARRIRRSRARAAKAPQPRFTLHAQEFFEAGEFRTPRPLHLEQEIFKQKPRRPLSEFTFPAERPSQQGPAPRGLAQDAAAATLKPRSLEPTPIGPSASFATLFGETVRINPLDSRPAAAAPSELAYETVRSPSASGSVTNQRFPPRSERPSGLRRGLAPGNHKDAGDAYLPSLRGSGTQGPGHAQNPNIYPDR